MSTAQKYEMLSQPNRLSHENAIVSMHGLHLRLDREAQLYRIAKSSVEQKQVTELVSAMARLDHPLIPHVIDFLDEPDAFHLVTEFVSGDTLSTTEDPFDQLSDLEQVASALCHASRVGLAHGALDASCLRAERSADESNVQRSNQGSIKLVGIGLQQFLPHDLDELHSADLSRLKELVAETIDMAILSESIEEGAEEDSPESKSLRGFQSRLAQNDDSICSFGSDFRLWLHKEIAIREAKKLAVSDRENESANKKKSNRIPIIAACCAAVVLLSGLLTYTLWPSKTRTTSVAANNVRPDELSKDELMGSDPQSPIGKPVTSSLQNVGVLNSEGEEAPETGAATDVDETVQALDAPGEPADTDPEMVVDAEAEEMEVATTEVDETESEEEQQEPPERKTNPFDGIAANVDLPERSTSESLELVSTDLRDDEPLQIQLLTAASKKHRFVLEEQEAGRWLVAMNRKSESTNIAEFERQDGTLYFRWLPEITSLPASNQIRNSIVVLRSEKWTGEFALRSVQVRPSVRFELERSRPYELELDFPPAEMFLEFVPDEGSLVTASPKQVPWNDAVMTVGLDAGKDSLVMLQLKPLPKTKLRTVCLVRQSKSAGRKAVKKGFGRALQTQVSSLNQNLFRMTQGVKTIKGKDANDRKKQVNRMIKRLEEQKKISDRLQEAYAAASAARVGLRIYSPVDDRKLILAEFSGPGSGSR